MKLGWTTQRISEMSFSSLSDNKWYKWNIVADQFHIHAYYFPKCYLQIMLSSDTIISMPRDVVSIRSIAIDVQRPCALHVARRILLPTINAIPVSMR